MEICYGYESCVQEYDFEVRNRVRIENMLTQRVALSSGQKGNLKKNNDEWE